MLIINRLEWPTLPGVHQVILDEQSAEMLRALAGAWNQRTVVSKVSHIVSEQDCPEVRRLVERDLTLALQDSLAMNRRTALWVEGPRWYRSPRPPALNAFDMMRADPMDNLTMHTDWSCEVRALTVPMASWDGTSWAPR